MKRIIEIIKEFETYDRIYHDGKMKYLVIAILCFLIMGLLILISVIIGGAICQTMNI